MRENGPHIQRVCRSSKAPDRTWQNKQNQKVNSCEFDDESLVGAVEINNVTQTNSTIIWLTPKLNGQACRMELDTGSAVSILPLQMYKKLFRRHPLMKTEVILRTYSGEKISPEGVMNVRVQYNNQTKNLQLYVVKTQGPALFGRDWLRQIQLNWRTIKSITKKVPRKDRQQRLQKLLDKYSEIFEEKVGTLKSTKTRLTMNEDTQPKFCRARPVPYALQPKVEAELKRLEREGILNKVAFSDWATPIVPVVKRNGEVRICGDFKVTVNPQLQTEQYPLPRIEDIFAKLAGGQKFTKIDLRQAYHQMEVHEESKKYLTINTNQGLYQYDRLVFGITSAPAIWQRSMDQVLEGVKGTSCILDDMIITGKDDDEHFKNLEEVLKRLEQHGLRAKKEKCQFFQEKITYCGHEVDKHGLHKTKEKVNAVVNALVLTHYNPNLPLKLACDASPVGIGAVLSHIIEDGTERPIAFASRTLNKAERKYSQIDKEALALVWGVKKFHLYLFGPTFHPGYRPRTTDFNFQPKERHTSYDNRTSSTLRIISYWFRLQY